MRTAVSLIALLVATPALAEDIFAQAPVTAAEIYPDGATLTLRATLEVPAGTHRVFVPYPGAEGLDSLPRITANDGVEIGALGFQRGVTTDPEALYTPAQTEAAATLEAARDAVRAQQNEIDMASAAITALEARVDYFARLTPPENPTPQTVRALADVVSADTAEAIRALTAARADLRPLEEELEDLERAREGAQAALDRLSPPEAVGDMLTVELRRAEAGPVTLEFTEQVWDAGWRVDYEIDLDRAAKTVAFDRKLIVTQGSARSWNDVALTLSTARPNDAIAPSPVWPDRADVFEPAPQRAQEEYTMDLARSAPAPVMEEAAGMKTAGLRVDGLAISYVYPDPVTIGPGEAAELALDTLSISAEPYIQAAPRHDETAFLMADITNSTGEPLLPGSASILRDGNYVGEGRIEMIPAGAEETLAFGPMDSIRLETILKRNAEGDEGIISRSSTRVQQITFTVENLSDETRQVRALFPLTFSEKEELEVEVTATPAPDEHDIEDKRGVSAWELTLAPGEKKAVDIEVELDWPEGKLLDWRP